MQHNDIKIGNYYKYKQRNGLWDLLFVLGRDPFTGKFVATSDAWPNAAVLLGDVDLTMMESI